MKSELKSFNMQNATFEYNQFQSIRAFIDRTLPVSYLLTSERYFG